MARSWRLSLFALASLALAKSALADVPPPAEEVAPPADGRVVPRPPPANPVPPDHGFVDPCTVSNREDANTRCETCSGEPEAVLSCRQRWQAQGYALACRAHARPVEVWCHKGVPAGGSRSAWVAVAAMGGLLGVGLVAKRVWQRRSLAKGS